MMQSKLIKGDFKDISCPNHTSIAIGCFDGVHLAHQEVIKNAIIRAKQNDAISTVLTFNPHPKQYFDRKNYCAINTFEENFKMIENLGIQQIIVLDFDKEFAMLNAKQFVEYIKNALNAKYVTTGSNFNFGQNRGGNSAFLLDSAKKMQFNYQAIKGITVEHEDASSTSIKQLVSMRCFRRAASLLGRKFFKHSIVQSLEIEKISSLEIVNIDIKFDTNHTIKLPNGVYFSTITNNMFSNSNPFSYKCLVYIEETHTCIKLLDILCGSSIQIGAEYKIEFTDFIRPIRKFETHDQTLYQLDIDCKALSYLSSFNV